MKGHEPTGEFVRVAEIEVDAVRPERTGFTLSGRGADKADYRMEMILDLPVDDQTRNVLGKLLSQSEWRILRRLPQSLRHANQEAGRPAGT